MEGKLCFERVSLEKCRFSVFALQVNDSNHAWFASWAAGQTGVHIVSDGSTCNEERQGAVAGVNFAVEHFHVAEHLMVIAG